MLCRTAIVDVGAAGPVTHPGRQCLSYTNGPKL
jgi:hypothetical protein